MISPGRYVLHAYLAYGDSQQAFSPESFATRMRTTLPWELGALVTMTANLPINPHAQTFKASGLHLGGGRWYVLATAFIQVANYTDESMLKRWVARSFWEAGAGTHSSADVTALAGVLGLCAGSPGPSFDWTSSNRVVDIGGSLFNGCISIVPDPGVTGLNWQAQTWNVARSGYVPWSHTTRVLPTVTTPPGPDGTGDGGGKTPSDGAPRPSPSTALSTGAKVAIGGGALLLLVLLVMLFMAGNAPVPRRGR